MSAHEDHLRMMVEFARSPGCRGLSLCDADAIDAVLAEVESLRKRLAEQCEATTVMGRSAASLGGRVQGLEAEVQSCHGELADAYVRAERAEAALRGLDAEQLADKIIECDRVFDADGGGCEHEADFHCWHCRKRVYTLALEGMLATVRKAAAVPPEPGR